MIELDSDSAVDEAAIAAGLAADTTALNAALEAINTGDGTAVAGDTSGTPGYENDGTDATTDEEKVAYIRSLNDSGELYLEGLAGFDQQLVGAGTAINFDFANANQIFNLESGQNNDVSVKIGALKNASYSADPEQSGTLFELGDLFELEVDTVGKGTALVSTGFLGVDTDNPSDGIANDEDITATGFELYNRTSNQNIQLNKVELTLNGDLNAFRADDAGNLLLKDGTASGWKLSSDGMSATTDAGDAVLQGNIDEDAKASSVVGTWSNLQNLYVEADNTTPVEAQSISVTAKIEGVDQDTYNDFEDTLSELFLITRDGLKFDTILTGTTSSNSVHIRDVSGILPEEGGKIYVTVWEYDAHARGESGERNVLADREELTVRLPSNGAVTVDPATIADQLGIEVAQNRQARMLFEVETNVGEVAVKKKDASGTDIQTGSQAEERDIVDFTL
ncbi:hypothetical protein BZG23_11390 [Salinivibrio sp. ML290]|nr:hypothetical protein BZG23_11390 [Salinivibrio sp. ML290]